MKRIGLPFVLSIVALALLGSIPAVAGQSAAKVPAASFVAIDQEVALVGLSDVVSAAPPCLQCIALNGACDKGAGTVCLDIEGQYCTCQWCGGDLLCRPSRKPRPLLP